MIKDFVMSEIKNETGQFLDDGEYVFACGLAFQRLTANERKNIRDKKKNIFLEIDTFQLLRIEMKSLMHEYSKEITSYCQEEQNLLRMVQQYVPKGNQLDKVMQEVLQEALRIPRVVNRYERQERYQRKVGLVSKTYKLNGKVVEDFANACKERGVALGPTLTELMIQFIQGNQP